MDTIPYPVRINRYLALTGIATRRDADLLIKDGLVTINGAKAHVGDTVEKADIVEVASRKKSYVYRAYYKPRGVISHSPQLKEKDIRRSSGYPDLFPVGRLDKASEGLIILTSDNRITERLLNPHKKHEKEYEVVVDHPLKPNFKTRMERGVRIEDYTTQPARLSILDEKIFRIILTEGKKHQIRRMCAALGYQIEKLKRIRIMNISLGKLAPNESRLITGDELRIFLETLNLRA